MDCSKVKVLSLVASGALACLSAQARTISANTVLEEDTDWTSDGVVTVEEGVTLDLAGHKLTVAGLAGAGVVTSSVAAAYQRLAYLEGTGGAYINTGYTPVSSTTADLRLRFTDLPTADGKWKTVFGTRHTGSAYKAAYLGVFLYRTGGKVYFWKALRGDEDANPVSVVTTLGVVATDVDYYLQLDKDGTSLINGKNFGTGLTGNCDYPALLFAMNNSGIPWVCGGDAAGSAAGQRLYYCRFAENGVVVHDFVPAKRLSDGVLGMYDLTANAFKTNAANLGSFTGGAVCAERQFATGELHLANTADSIWNCSQLKVASNVAVVADGGTLTANTDWRALGTVFTTAGETLDLDGYTLKVSGLGGAGTLADGSAYEFLDYIEGTGAQYINTGYTMGSATIADFKAQFTGLPNSSGKWHGVFGMRTSNSDAAGACVFTYYNVNKVNFWRTLAGTDVNMPDLGTVATGVDYTFHVDKTGTGPTTVTGGSFNQAVLGTARNGTCAGPAYIFNLNQNGKVWNQTYCAKMRLYSLTVSENGTVMRDYRPVRRKADGAVGLYELRRCTFLGNSGTGTFVAGSVTNGTSERVVGELHVDVPEGVEVENRDVRFQGSLKFVKDGAGAFIPFKGDQFYTGGTLIAGGEFRCAMNGGSFPRYTSGGPESEVTVADGGYLNFDGNANYQAVKFVLAGGEIHSDTDHAGMNAAWISNLRLTADSKISGAEYGLVNASANAMTVDLGGHTLTLDVPTSKEFYICNTTFTGGGKLVANTGGWVSLGKHSKSCTFAEGTTFEARGTAIQALQPTTIAGTYQSCCSQNADAGPNMVMSVTGRFRPETALFHSTVMKNGATLDLGAQTGVFPVQCHFSGSNVYGTLAFESNAVISVELGDRRLKSEQIVSWADSGTKPDDSVEFVLDPAVNARLIRKSDGLWLRTGLLILIR